MTMMEMFDNRKMVVKKIQKIKKINEMVHKEMVDKKMVDKEITSGSAKPLDCKHRTSHLCQSQSLRFKKT